MELYEGSKIPQRIKLMLSVGKFVRSLKHVLAITNKITLIIKTRISTFRETLLLFEYENHKSYYKSNYNILQSVVHYILISEVSRVTEGCMGG
jgi:hypothetical protein